MRLGGVETKSSLFVTFSQCCLQSTQLKMFNSQVDMQVWAQGKGLNWKDKMGFALKTMGLEEVTQGVSVDREAKD